MEKERLYKRKKGKGKGPGSLFIFWSQEEIPISDMPRTFGVLTGDPAATDLVHPLAAKLFEEKPVFSKTT